MKPIRYHVRHDTHYHYDQPVGESHQLLRLSPRDLAWQTCVSHRIDIDPGPVRVQTRLDGFGNAVQALHFHADHDHLSVRAEAWIELRPRPHVALADSPPWTAVRDGLRYKSGLAVSEAALNASAFLFESSFVRVKRDFADYARADFTDGTPLLVGVDGLMRRIFSEFTFDPDATDVSTPVTTVFAERRGVCQDFAHFMLSCLRSLGLAARYMSGYILTRPPQGGKRLIGADATHAWIAVYCPRNGWVEFDPTNAIRPDLEHITIGWGRDFADISPMRGVIIGGGGHKPAIAVTVVPEDEFTELYTDAELPMLDLEPRRARSG